MKNIAQIMNGEIVEHKGDVTVEGNVGDGAQINIQDGSLIIIGNVGSKTNINVYVSPELLQKPSNTLSFTTRGAAGGSGFSTVISENSIVGGSSANLVIGNIYFGNVNIKNRIFTDGQLTALGNDSYKIEAGHFNPSARSSSTSNHKREVRAKIDGITYTGYEIIVQGKKWSLIIKNLGHPHHPLR